MSRARDVRRQARREPVAVGCVSLRVQIERIVSQWPAPERRDAGILE